VEAGHGAAVLSERGAMMRLHLLRLVWFAAMRPTALSTQRPAIRRRPLQDRTRGRWRGHHPGVFTGRLAAGGAKGGYVHGRSDAIGERVAENPVTMPDFNATIAMALGLDLEYIEHALGPALTGSDKGKPVPALFA
jgi:hypothetical protein